MHLNFKYRYNARPVILKPEYHLTRVQYFSSDVKFTYGDTLRSAGLWQLYSPVLQTNTIITQKVLHGPSQVISTPTPRDNHSDFLPP